MWVFPSSLAQGGITFSNMNFKLNWNPSFLIGPKEEEDGIAAHMVLSSWMSDSNITETEAETELS